jgi:hypothetical protein
MATFSFSDMSAVFPQQFMNDLRPQIQRKCPTLSVLQMKRSMTGQNIQWATSFAGQIASNVNPDGGSLLTAVADPRTAAQLGYGYVSAPIKVTTKDQMLAANSVANGGPGFLNGLIAQNLSEAVQAACKYINQQIFSGTGAGNQLTGLSLAVAGSGTYATIAPSGSYAGWVATSQGNAGSLRSLTLALIKTQASTIAAISPKGRPDMAICTSAVFNTLENLFDGTVYTQAGRNDLQWGKVMTNAGMINARGFRSLAWVSAGITFIEDPDCTNTAVTNTSNCIYFLNSDSVELQYLDPAPVPYMPDQQVVAASEQGMGQLGSLKFDLRARGRTTMADEFDIVAGLNVVVKDRPATGILFDVQ